MTEPGDLPAVRPFKLPAGSDGPEKSAVTAARLRSNRDPLLAGAVTAVSAALVVVAAFTSGGSDGRAIQLLETWWLVFIVLAAQGVALALASKAAPSIVLVIVAALPLALAPVDAAAIASIATVPVLVAVFLVGTRCGAPGLQISLITAAVLVITTSVLEAVWSTALPLAILFSLIETIVLFSVPLAVAYVADSRHRMVKALEAEKEALKRMSDALAQAAVARERAGIARELHDIAAHHLSGISLLAAAIERQVDAAPESAKTGIRQIRSQSRLILGDLRQVVGLLRSGAQRASIYRLDAIPDLIQFYAESGDPVELRTSSHVDDGRAELGPLAQLTGYRMVQEALANATRHAPGSHRMVRIEGDDDGSVLITVRNGPATREPELPQMSGYGLQGMRERADLVRAVLDYGSTSDGGWEVSMRFASTVSAAAGDDA